MRSKLHTVLASAALMAAAVLATNSAMAETTLKVPFSFTVAGKICPAGHYTVKENAIGSYVTLTNEDSSRVFTWILLPSAPDYKSGNVVLKFDVAGQTHLLRSVQIGSMTTSVLDKNVGNSEYRSAELAAHQGQ
jgi:type 1 fimbria pilin